MTDNLVLIPQTKDRKQVACTQCEEEIFEHFLEDNKLICSCALCGTKAFTIKLLKTANR